MPNLKSRWSAGALLLCLLILPAGCKSRSASSDGVPLIRVRLVNGVTGVNVGASSPASFSTAVTPAMTFNFTEGQLVPVAYEGDRWRIGSAVIPGGELMMVGDVDGAIALEGSPYRGHFKFVPTGGGKFDVINHVDSEAYLQGVLARELFPSFHPEAYKAQAIVARTYALYEVKSQGGDRSWDVWADVKSQVYGGVKAETAKANAAVADTRGIVAGFGPPKREKIFKAYFSACCGGVGQNVYDAFGDPFIPPLTDRKVGDLCAISTKFNWGPVTIEKSELTRRIKIWAAARKNPIERMAMLDRIEIETINRGGRPVRFMLTDVNGQRYSLGSEETRWACNADRGNGPYLWSSFFKPVTQQTSIAFTEAHGSGHGVGMCQWCAESMARRGVPAEEIVRFSYPKSVLVKAY